VNAQLLFGKFANRDDQQDYNQYADHRPNPHPSACPSIHPSAWFIIKVLFWLHCDRPTTWQSGT
jgi:hypothetical protein